MRGPVALAAAFLVFLIATGPALAQSPPQDRLFQYSTINALLAGLYDGEMTLGELAREGNSGLGTLNGVDGELIVIDGDFYAVKADGKAYQLSPEEKTPFAVMTFFSADVMTRLPAGLDYAALQTALDDMIVDKNLYQAIRIDGSFTRMTVRSEPKQSPPYRPLAEVIKEQQVVFELSEVTGTLIGFRLPGYLAGLNVPGYHFHFLTEDRQAGGHVLDLTTTAGEIRIDTLSRLALAVPETRAFNEVGLEGAREDELDAVETQK